MTTNITQRVAVAAITRGSCRIWAVNDPAGSLPELILRAPDDQHRNHFKQVNQNAHHGTERFDRAYFEEITAYLFPAKEVLLIGHGTGKANEMLKFVQYLERYHPILARKVVGAEDTDLEALSDSQILDLAKRWFREPVHAR